MVIQRAFKVTYLARDILIRIITIRAGSKITFFTEPIDRIKSSGLWFLPVVIS